MTRNTGFATILSPLCCQQKHRKKRKELSAPNFSLMDIWPENEEMDFFTDSNGV
jgi:hypothetical protein